MTKTRLLLRYCWQNLSTLLWIGTFAFFGSAVLTGLLESELPGRVLRIVRQAWSAGR